MGLPISDLHGRMILDSRGNPTIEVECYASIDIPSRSTVPSGAVSYTHLTLPTNREV